MLSPEINDAKGDLTSAYQSSWSLDNFAFSSRSLQVVQLHNEPKWLPPVRAELDALRRASESWTIDRPDLWSDVLLAFLDYVPTFSSVAQQAKAGAFKTSDDWITMLEQTLLPGLKKSVSTTKAVQHEVDTHRSKFGAVLPEMDKSIEAGWQSLGSQEKEMFKLASEIGGLNQTVQSLGAKLTTDALTGGKSYVSSAVSLLYAAGAAGASASIPILGIATTVLTLGKTFYDIIKDNQDLIDTMEKIAKLQANFTADEQAVALTKATLQVLYGLETSYLATSNALPGLVDMWSTEQIKVQNAINALQAGAAPDQYLDLLTIATAETNWDQILGYVRRLGNIDIKFGQPVTLNIGEASIEPTAGALVAVG